MDAEVVAVGSEPLLGQVVDTDSAVIARHFAVIGLNLSYRAAVSDDQGRLVGMRRQALDRSDANTATGGIRPTAVADLTRKGGLARPAGRRDPTRASVGYPVMAIAPSASYSLTVRVQIANRPGMLGRVASAIGNAGGDIGSVDIVESNRERVVRDVAIKARDSVHGQQIVGRLKRIPGVRVVSVSDRTFLMHLGGKIEVRNKVPIRTCFPGFFRGLLDSRARTVNDTMKLAAAHAIAGCVSRTELSEEYIIPSVFNKRVAPAVAQGVARAARDSGTAGRRRRRAFDPSTGAERR